jgi:predicted Zn-dependent protease
MRRSAAVRSAVLATALLLVLSCVSTNLPPISSQGGGFAPLRDEQALWEESRAEEAKLLTHVRLVGDSRLEAYLDRVADRLNPPGAPGSPLQSPTRSPIQYRVRVIADPSLNAFAYPHGSIYLHSGLLARLDGEDELATVLGHEMTHVDGRHMLRRNRSAHNKEVGFTIAAVAAAVAIAVAADGAWTGDDWGSSEAVEAVGNVFLEFGLQLAWVASIDGYGRALEAEADEGGFARMAAAGYDVREAPKVYQALLDESLNNGGEPRRAEAFFFSSHPRLRERQAAAGSYLARHPEAATAEVARDADFGRHLQPVVREDARLNLEQGRLKLADAELTKARAWRPDDPETQFLKGRLRLAQSLREARPEERGRLERAAEDAFRKAIELDASLPGPHRELGLLLYRQHDHRGACTQLRRYLRLDPDAPETDATEAVEDALAAMEQLGSCG